jgi:hypothetical protein
MRVVTLVFRFEGNTLPDWVAQKWVERSETERLTTMHEGDLVAQLDELLDLMDRHCRHLPAIVEDKIWEIENGPE